MSPKYEKGWMKAPIDTLVLADWNYKTNDEALEKKLTENLKRNGQIENIIVRELDTGYLETCNGNHRVKVMREMGTPEVYCFNLGKISDAQARRIAVETNETRFSTDNIRLAELISEITQEFPDLDELSQTMPYSPEELENFNKLLTFDWEQYGSSESGGSEADTPPEPDDEGAGGQICLKFSSEDEKRFWCDVLGVDGSMDTYTVEQWKRLHKEEES